MFGKCKREHNGRTLPSESHPSQEKLKVFPLSSSQEDLSSPLHVACINSYYDMVKLLLLNGASVHAEDAEGMTPILRLFNLVRL